MKCTLFNLLFTFEMSSCELFPTAVNKAISENKGNVSVLSPLNNNKNKAQIARPQTKISSVKQSPKVSTNRAATSFSKRNQQIPKSQSSFPSIRKNERGHNNKRIKISKRTYEALDNPQSLPCNIDELKSIVAQLQYLQEKHSKNQEYPEAQHVQRILRTAENKLKIEQNRKSSAVDIKDTVIKQQELQAIINKFMKDWNEHYQYFMDTTERELNTLEKQQKDELERFDESLPKSLLPKYRKQSIALIEMRDKERALALNKRYLAAEKMKNKADEAEAEEELKNIKTMQEDFDKKRGKIIQKHKEQKRVFLQHVEATRTKMIYQRDQLLDGYKKRMKLIDGNIKALQDEGKLTENDMNNFLLSEQRELLVTDNEYSYPIPRIRPGTSFMNARNGITTASPQTSFEDQHNDEHYDIKFSQKKKKADNLIKKDKPELCEGNYEFEDDFTSASSSLNNSIYNEDEMDKESNDKKSISNNEEADEPLSDKENDEKANSPPSDKSLTSNESNEPISINNIEEAIELGLHSPPKLFKLPPLHHTESEAVHEEENNEIVFK